MSKKSTRLSLFAKFYKFGKVISTLKRFRKQSFLRQVEAKFTINSIDKVYLECKYSPTESNAGFYSTYEEFSQAYEAFTEKALIEYIGRR